METKNPQPAGKLAGASVSIRADAVSLTKSTLNLQPATVTELRALTLISRHQVAPAMALTLAALCFGEAGQ